MNKKEICTQKQSFAYYSGFNGLELKHIEHGTNNYIYCVSGAWGARSKRGYHKLKVYYDNDGGYVRLHGYKIPLNDCIKMEVN